MTMTDHGHPHNPGGTPPPFQQETAMIPIILAALDVVVAVAVLADRFSDKD